MQYYKLYVEGIAERIIYQYIQRTPSFDFFILRHFLFIKESLENYSGCMYSFVISKDSSF